jgi:hypothetical protein
MLQKHTLVKPIHPQDLADAPAPVIVVFDIDIFFLLQLGFHPMAVVGRHRIYIAKIRPLQKTLQKLLQETIAEQHRLENHCPKNLPH